MARDILELLLNEEFEDMVEAVTQDNSIGSKIDAIDDKGNVLFPIGASLSWGDIVEIFESPFSEYSGLKVNSEDNFINYDYLYNEVNDSVKRIKCSPAKAIQILQGVIPEAKKDLMGALWIDETKPNWVLNPLHPLVAYGIMNGMYELPKEVTMLLFLYKDGSSNFNKINDEYVDAMKSLFGAELKIIDKTLGFDIESQIQVRGTQRDFDNIYAPSMTSAYVEYNSSMPRGLLTIVPVQSITKGEILPYYGNAIVSEGGVGMNLPGTISGNIKYGFYNGRDREGVCTGDYSNRSVTGWRTLNRLNVNSTWYSEYVNRDFKSIALAAIELSHSIYSTPTDSTEEEEGGADE